MVFNPTFKGDVHPGHNYLILDDTLMMGGTLASLRGYIENRGGNVIGAAVMIAHLGAVDLAVKPAMLEAIARKHGPAMNAFRITQSEPQPQARYRAKFDLVRSLYRQGWDRQRVLDLFAVIDWMMRLPNVLEQQLWQAIETVEGETKMRYVTTVERLAIQRGMQQGLEQGRLEGKIKGLERLLVKRFGPRDEATRKRLDMATLE